MSPAQRRDVERLCKDVHGIAMSTALDLCPQTGRLLPSIAPAHLWRVLPRILRRVVRVADAVGIELRADERRTLESVAELIEHGKAPGVRP